VIQPSEVVALVFSLIAVGAFWFILRHRRGPRLHMMVVGALCMIVGYVCTVLEGFVWEDAFNTIEHVCYALSGVAFAVGSLRLTRAGASPEEAP